MASDAVTPKHPPFFVSGGIRCRLCGVLGPVVALSVLNERVIGLQDLEDAAVRQGWVHGTLGIECPAHAIRQRLEAAVPGEWRFRVGGSGAFFLQAKVAREGEAEIEVGEAFGDREWGYVVTVRAEHLPAKSPDEALRQVLDWLLANYTRTGEPNP